jgi:hypothetical protein
MISTPFFSQNIATAATFYYDHSNSSLAICCAKSDTQPLGLVMIRDRDNDAYGPVYLSREVGTARMSFVGKNSAAGDQSLLWKNDRFGSWLACDRGEGKIELHWWDVIANLGVDLDVCAKIDLVEEEVPAGNVDC